jgi:hypothetical protein
MNERASVGAQKSYGEVISYIGVNKNLKSKNRHIKDGKKNNFTYPHHSPPKMAWLSRKRDYLVYNFSNRENKSLASKSPAP